MLVVDIKDVFHLTASNTLALSFIKLLLWVCNFCALR